MSGKRTCAQRGGRIRRQRRRASKRHSVSQPGSSFFAEMARTTSSLKPGGKVSASMSVTNPAAYSRLTSASIWALAAGMGSGFGLRRLR